MGDCLRRPLTTVTASTCVALVSAAGAAQLNEQPAEGQAENATEVKTIYIDVGGIPRACTDQCASIVDFAGRCDGKLMNATQCQARASMFCVSNKLGSNAGSMPFQPCHC